MDKDQTALDVSRDIELKKVMPQQAAQTLTDEIELYNDLNRVPGNTNTAIAKHLLSLGYRKSHPVAQQAVPALPVAPTGWRERIQEMYDADYIYGDVGKETARIVLDGVSDMLDELEADAASQGAKEAEPVAIPHGFKLVPAKPTEEMIEAAFSHLAKGGGEHPIHIYQKMLDAAPTASMQPANERAAEWALALKGRANWDAQATEGTTRLMNEVADFLLSISAAPVVAQQEAAQPVGEVVLFGADCKEVAWKKGKLPPVGTKLYAAPIGQDSRNAVLEEIAAKLRRAGASIPAPDPQGTIESAMKTGLSVALVLVDDAIRALKNEAAQDKDAQQDTRNSALIPVDAPDEWVEKVLRAVQPNLSVHSKAWRELTEEMLYWHQAMIATAQQVQQKGACDAAEK